MAHQLAILGPVPPPYGGIAVHVERFIPYMEREGIDYIIYNTAGPTEVPGRIISVADRKKSWFLRYLFTGREPAVYILNVKWESWVGSYFLSRFRGKKVVLSLQGDDLRLALDPANPIARWLILAAFRCATHVIVASQHLYDHLMSLGDFQGKTTIIPAFVPPLQKNEDAASISPEIVDFCASHHPVVLATGASVLRDNGIDLYGIDMTIEMVDALRSKYPKVGVLWSLIEIIGHNPQYADELRARVRERGLDEHWLFSPSQDVFYPVYELVDLLVRPTFSDGDALTIREGLHFGVPTIASDVAPRPEGTIIFPTRNQDEFEKTVLRTLETLETERERLRDHRSSTSVEEELGILKQLLADVAG